MGEENVSVVTAQTPKLLSLSALRLATIAADLGSSGMCRGSLVFQGAVRAKPLTVLCFGRTAAAVSVGVKVTKTAAASRADPSLGPVRMVRTITVDQLAGPARTRTPVGTWRRRAPARTAACPAREHKGPTRGGRIRLRPC